MTYTLKLVALAILGVFATSCSEEQGWLDSDSLLGTNLRVVEIDTFQMDMSTFRFDSIANDSGTRVLVGQYDDPVFGRTRAEVFMEFVASTYYIPEGSVLDSIVLNMPYDGYFYADTLAIQHVEVRRLTQTIKLANGVENYYNTADFDASDTPIGEKAFRPRISRDSTTTRLSDAFGQELLEKIRSGEIVSNEGFTDVFKGLKISSGEQDNGSVIGYNVNDIYIRLYYSEEDDDDDQSDTYLDFKLNRVAEFTKYANRITSERSGTVFSGLANQEQELDGQTYNHAYVQGGIGIGTKIMLPTIRSIRQINDNNGKIFKANLKLRVDPNLYDEHEYPVDSMYVAIVDQNNDVLQLLKDESGNEVTAYLETENNEYNEVYVVAPIATFLEKIIEYPEYLNYGLVLLPHSYNSSVSRLILNVQNQANTQSKLEIIYAIYD